MKVYKLPAIYLFFLMASFQLKAQEPLQAFQNDSITLAQAYMNLTLTRDYFDKLSDDRLSKILSFEKNELTSLADSGNIGLDSLLFNFTSSLLYFNEAKFSFRKKPKSPDRAVLTKWFNTLRKAIEYYNRPSSYVSMEDNAFYAIIKFEDESYGKLRRNIKSLKSEFTPYFNNDVYPDFKRIFYEAKRSKAYNFKKLKYYASLYNLSLDMSIIENQPNYLKYYELYVDQYYKLDLKLDLIARYLQLKYMVSGQYTKKLAPVEIQRLYEAYQRFYTDIVTNDQNLKEDAFMREELNPEVCKVLYGELKTKYPNPEPKGYGDGAMAFSDEAAEPLVLKRYFFPNPAPLPSAKITIKNYRPELVTLENVDTYVSNIFKGAGYKNQLHYYYDLDGYAMTTSLEKFNKNGDPIEDTERWVKNLGGDGKFSYFEIFKSLFFEIESEFRMFALIMASKKVRISNTGLTPGRAEMLIKNSHPTLPDDLKNKILVDKNLTILVYHFHQNDIGQVPMLNLNGKIKVTDHLKNAGLSKLIEN